MTTENGDSKPYFTLEEVQAELEKIPGMKEKLEQARLKLHLTELCRRYEQLAIRSQTLALKLLGAVPDKQHQVERSPLQKRSLLLAFADYKLAKALLKTAEEMVGSVQKAQDETPEQASFQSLLGLSLFDPLLDNLNLSREEILEFVAADLERQLDRLDVLMTRSQTGLDCALA